jgi:hypothetical protein
VLQFGFGNSLLLVTGSHVPSAQGIARTSYKVCGDVKLSGIYVEYTGYRKEEFSVIIIGLDGAGKTVRQ